MMRCPPTHGNRLRDNPLRFGITRIGEDVLAQSSENLEYRKDMGVAGVQSN